jgi:hemoglobin
MSQPSLYDRLGGEPAVDAAVDIFYRKVLGDPRISSFFDTVDMDRQRAAHAHMKITEAHFNAVMENLGGTLKELKVPEALIAEAAAIALSVKNEVLNR